MKTLILGDLHEHVRDIELVLKSQKPYDSVIFLGDYFDSFSSTTQSVKDTCDWLKYSLTQPHRVHLMGNHEQVYRWPKIDSYACSGNTLDKCKYINTVITPQEWEKLKLFHFEQNFYMSHGGIQEDWACHPMEGFSRSYLETICNKAIEDARIGQPNRILCAGKSRGGRYWTGGITWEDWSQLKPIPNANQIVGHTPNKTVRYQYLPNKKHPNSINVCIDCLPFYIGKIVDGKFEEVKIKC